MERTWSWILEEFKVEKWLNINHECDRASNPLTIGIGLYYICLASQRKDKNREFVTQLIIFFISTVIFVSFPTTFSFTFLKHFHKFWLRTQECYFGGRTQWKLIIQKLFGGFVLRRAIYYHFLTLSALSYLIVQSTQQH